MVSTPTARSIQCGARRSRCSWDPRPITPQLPLFYVRMGAAMHALEDGFAHTYRTADGMRVTVVLNWIDLVSGTYEEPRDGPLHRAELDRCGDADPTIHRNYELATQAATELLRAALDPALGSDQKVRQFAAVTAKYLTYEHGCTFDNNWCSPAEAMVTNSVAGCNASRQAGLTLCFALALVGVLVVGRRRRGRSPGCSALFWSSSLRSRRPRVQMSHRRRGQRPTRNPAVPTPAADPSLQ